MEPSVQTKRAAVKQPKVERILRLIVSQIIQQGDVYIQYLGPLRDAADSEHEEGVKGFKATPNNYRLAPDEGRGARHEIAADDRSHVRITAGSRGSLCIFALEPFTLTHPDHDWFVLPAGRYLSSLQVRPGTARNRHRGD